MSVRPTGLVPAIRRRFVQPARVISTLFNIHAATYTLNRLLSFGTIRRIETADEHWLWFHIYICLAYIFVSAIPCYHIQLFYAIRIFFIIFVVAVAPHCPSVSSGVCRTGVALRYSSCDCISLYVPAVRRCYVPARLCNSHFLLISVVIHDSIVC